MIHRMIPYKSIISIHALREEGDLSAAVRYLYQHISIHALREEGDMEMSQDVTAIKKFLSTPSARRATSTRRSVNASRSISIHALREEGDLDILERQLQINKFLSTPSARRATRMKPPPS